MKILPWCCPDITCREFGKPVDVESYEVGDSTGGFPDIATSPEVIHDDEGHCGGCDCRMATQDDWKTALARSIREHDQR